MPVKGRDTLGSVVKGRCAEGHSRSDWSPSCFFLICNCSLGHLSAKPPSLGGGRNEEEVGELSHCSPVIYPRGW